MSGGVRVICTCSVPRPATDPRHVGDCLACGLRIPVPDRTRSRESETKFLRGIPHPDLDEIIEKVQTRLDVGERKYGQDSFFLRSRDNLLDEIEAEALDLMGWSALAQQAHPDDRHVLQFIARLGANAYTAVDALRTGRNGGRIVELPSDVDPNA